MLTTYERGRLAGLLEGQRQMALMQLGARFGPLSPAVKQRVGALSPEELTQLLLDFAKGLPLKLLHLVD